MRRLLGYMRPYSGYVAVSLVFLLLQSVLQVLGPLLTKIAVDRYLAPSPTRVSTPIDRYLPAGPWDGLAAVGLLYLGVLLVLPVSAFPR
jgi:ATP-binding cassette subfamily B multidrug efflux pump